MALREIRFTGILCEAIRRGKGPVRFRQREDTILSGHDPKRKVCWYLLCGFSESVMLNDGDGTEGTRGGDATVLIGVIIV